jgi:hypothetical protein
MTLFDGRGRLQFRGNGLSGHFSGRIGRSKG